MQEKQLGKNGPTVSAIGLGCMGMSGMYGPADSAESLVTIHSALERGITLFDSGDFYGMGHNELLLNRALSECSRYSYLLSIKFGALRDPAGGWVGYDARPTALKNFLAYSLKRLHTDYIDIYRPARLDPNVPIEDTIGAIADMVQAGYVRYIGLSEVGEDTIRRAVAVHPICDLQIEYSMISRGIEENILTTCRDLGVGITAYGVLSRGLLSGHWSMDKALKDDWRLFAPRFQPGNIERNLDIVEVVRAMAEKRSISVAQMAIAWVLAQGDDIVPLIGARRRDQLQEALGGLAVKFTKTELAQLEQSIPRGCAAGDRYAPEQMIHLDSERG